MMSKKSKKYQIEEELNFVQEPTLEYNKEMNLHQKSINDEWNDLPDFVKESIKIGIEESKEGVGVSHNEFMKIVKEKYPFVNGI